MSQNTPSSTPAAGAPQPAAPQPSAAQAPTPKMVKASRKTVLFMGLLALGGILLILWTWRVGPFATATMKTDNAYVRGKMTLLSSQVSGNIVEMAVQDFEQVEADQLLLRIDDKIYRQRVDQAQAQLHKAQLQLKNWPQAMAQNKATENANTAALASARAEDRRAQTDFKRIQDLAARGSLSQRELDQARATAQLSKANVDKAQAAVQISQEAIKATEVSQAELQTAVEAAQAQLEQAEIDLAHTVIRAPVAGQLGEATPRVGQYVTTGTQLMYVVPSQTWVVANFKETQLRNMRIGQPATFTVDALGSQVLTGKVQDISPATGSEFSLLRADNATGNFTKVLHRVPVRIAIVPDQKSLNRLRPGLSVIASVDTSVTPQEDEQ